MCFRSFFFPRDNLENVGLNVGLIPPSGVTGKCCLLSPDPQTRRGFSFLPAPRGLPGFLQQQREVHPGSQWVALHLPGRLERGRLSRRHGNALHRRQGQRRRYVAPGARRLFSAAGCLTSDPGGSVSLLHAEIFPCPSDGLVDCLDPDCCLQLSCQSHLYCRGSPDPAEVLGQSASSSDPQRVRTAVLAARLGLAPASVKQDSSLSSSGRQVFLSAHSLFGRTCIHPRGRWRQPLQQKVRADGPDAAAGSVSEGSMPAAPSGCPRALRRRLFPA